MSNGDDNLVPIVFDRPAKPPKPPAPPPEEHEMNELNGLLPVWLRDREVTTPGFAPANTHRRPD
jgi:hypothetical protein